jgi:hypothetical protein
MKKVAYFGLILVCCSCSSKFQKDNQVARVLWPGPQSTVTCCEVREQRPNPDALPNRELTMVDPRGNRLTVLRTHDSFLAMYPTGEEGSLFITVWVAGSAYKIRAFYWDRNKPRLVLDRGSKTFPEIITREPGGLFIILSDITGHPAEQDNWTATRYSWDGNSLVKFHEGPFSSRFAGFPK